jgi:uncharacterized RDD family membrane protein YckC
MVVAPTGARAAGLDRYANLASRLTRLIAFFVDLLLFAFVAGIGRAAGRSDGEALAGLLLIALLVLQVILLGRDGQTVGKKLLAVRIVDADTRQHAGFFKTVVLRVVLNGLLSLIPGYGLVDALLIFRDDRRCLHDLIAGTVVVRA